ncbi:30S ribosomal protein S9 [Candidatus Parcubacteria bacterium]|nr:30S ribosomal protein S9 [Candidatus Parcubacteria bacterium]
MSEDKKYIETVGRRKTSIARVRITEAGKSSILINDRELAHYFPTADLQRIATEAITKVKAPSKFKITVHLKGGGISSQAEAFRHGLARALTEYDVEFKGKLKKAGFLKRDPRAKERRKFGLKKARKAPQWSKR